MEPVTVVLVVLLAAQLPVVGVTLYMLLRSDRTLATRYLAGSLLFQSGAMLVLGINFTQVPLGTLPPEGPALAARAGFAMAAVSFLAFALTFPAPPPIVARHRAWLLAPFAFVLWIAAVSAYEYRLDGPHYQGYIEDWLAMAVWATFALAPGTLLVRAVRTRRRIDRTRRLYMMVIGLVLFPLLYMAHYLLTHAFGDYLQHVLFLPIVAAAGVALAYGVLRYRIVDLTRRVRRGVRYTLKGGLLSGIFLLVFFAASELAERIVESETNSAAVGVGAAGLLALAARPLERAAERLALAAVPARSFGDAEYRRRSAEIYRVTVEDLVRQGGPAPEHRPFLDHMARVGGLAVTRARTIERAALAEGKVPVRHKRAPLRASGIPAARTRTRPST